jgi:methylthioribulose-1-phosphate dehydratase
MAVLLDQQPPRSALIEIARDFHARGWMAGTAGNLSARDDAASFWITASGRPKGRLEESDFLLVRIADGEVIERPTRTDKPSAETAIHCALYRCFPEAHACLHVHTVDASLAAASIASTSSLLALPALEMIKGLDIWEQHPQVGLPLFDNHLDVSRIAGEITTRFQATPPQVPALMVRGHGITVWGNSLQQAYNRAEIVEFMLSYMARLPADKC